MGGCELDSGSLAACYEKGNETLWR